MVTALVVTVLGVALLTSNASAQTPTGTQDPMSTIVQKIADKFGLKKEDVQAVFDQVHQEHHAQMQIRMEEKLTKAVQDGKITEAQKQAILKKFAEIKNNKPDPQAFQNMTDEQRKQAMEQKRSEFESWAKENGITLSTLQEVMGHGKGFGIKGMWHLK